MIYTLENDSLKVQVNSHGGELWSIQTKDGAEYLWQGDETYWKDRALNLFPYIARLTEGKYMLDGKTYEMPIHGFVNSSDLEVEEHHDGEGEDVAEAGNKDVGQQPPNLAM